MSAILSTSSRSKSRMSWSVFLPARSSTSTSSTGRPLSSRSDTLVAASSSGGSGANSGPSPPRSSHSRLEYRSIFQPVSSDASRTFWPFRPMASDSWSSSTIAWIVLVSGSENTRATRAGASDSFAKRSGSGYHGTMSMRSPPGRSTPAWTPAPLSPTPELAGFVVEPFADPGALARAHPLDDALLRGLHGGAPERLEGHFLLEHVADLEVRVLEARFLERHLRARVLHGLDHRAEHDDPDRALQLVDADLGPHVGAVALHQRRVQPVLQQIEQLRALELLRVRQLTDRGNYVACIRRHWFLVTSPLPAARRGSRPRARAAAPRPRARAPPSPRRAPPRCGRARDPDRRPWPAPRVRRSAASGGASAAAGRVPGSRPRARSAAPRAHPRRARLPTRGSPSRSRPPSPAATHAAAAIRCALERAAELACRRYGGRPVRGPRQPAEPEMIRRECRRA